MGSVVFIVSFGAVPILLDLRIEYLELAVEYNDKQSC